MKKLFLFIFLGFIWSNVGFTNVISKIENVEINGISIGDNLLDHFSKKELIQNKKLLDVNSAKQKLYYTSLIDQGMFYYESTERFGMTEKPIYRIIGMSITQSCDARSLYYVFSEDESIRLLTECIKTSFEKKLIKFDNIFLNLLDLYFEKKYDPKIEVMESGSLRYVESTKLGTGCYSDQVSVEYYSMNIDETTNSFKSRARKDFEKGFIKKKGEKIINENKKNIYSRPSMNIFLISKELDEILYSSKYC
jgi:hypothetical protein